MAKILAYIIAFLFAMCVCLIFALVIAIDAMETRKYFKASKAFAKVDRCDGMKNTSNYGLGQPATKYSKYIVSYNIENSIYSGVFLSKKRFLAEGDIVEIHYIIGKDGIPEIINRDVKDRFVRLLFCMALAVPVCIIGIVCS